MKKTFYIFVASLFLLGQFQVLAQETLIDTFAFENLNAYNSFWGISDFNGTLALGSDFDGEIFNLDENMEIVSSIPLQDPIDFCHGLAWDGEYFWVAEDYNSSGANLYKISVFGTIDQTIELPQVLEGNPSGVGDLSYEDGHLWFTIYFPDFDEFPYAHAYKLNLETEEIVENIPLYGKQVYGIATHGNHIYYVTDNLDDDPERIYVYDKAANDTIYSFPLLDPDGDSSPRGLHWFENHLYLLAKRPGGSAFQYSMLYKYEIELGDTPLEISISTDTLNFGEIEINDLNAITFLINNEEEFPIDITSLETDNSVFTVNGFNSNSFPITLETGDAIEVQITFEPQDTIDYFSLLNIIINGNTDNNITVQLLGTGFAEPKINVLSYELDLGEIVVGNNSFQSFSIQNTGTAILEITEMTIDNEIYSISTEQELPIIIEPASERQIEVSVNIEMTGENNGLLTIISNSETESELTIQLRATGIFLTDLNDPDFIRSTQVYPNPVTSEFRLDIQSAQNISNISICDIHGKTIQILNKENLEDYAVDIRNLNNGLYFINIKRKDGRLESIKILKE